jgi:hypothetical protein
MAPVSLEQGLFGPAPNRPPLLAVFARAILANYRCRAFAA